MRLAFVLSILVLGFSTLDCRADKRIALVVGNSNYQSVASLNNPRNDAALIAETLRKTGFTLVGNRAQLDLDKPAFDKAIQTFGNELMRIFGPTACPASNVSKWPLFGPRAMSDLSRES